SRGRSRARIGRRGRSVRSRLRTRAGEGLSPACAHRRPGEHARPGVLHPSGREGDDEGDDRGAGCQGWRGATQFVKHRWGTTTAILPLVLLTPLATAQVSHDEHNAAIEPCQVRIDSTAALPGRAAGWWPWSPRGARLAVITREGLGVF